MTFVHWELKYSFDLSISDVFVTMLHHSHEKRKESLETRALLFIFFIELKISGVAIQGIHQNSENHFFQWRMSSLKWLWGCFICFHLLWIWFQYCWGSWEDRYRLKRLLQMLLVCYSLLLSQSISSITVKKVGYSFTSGVAKKNCRSYTQKGTITCPWWVLSKVEVRSEITRFPVVTSWMGYS